MQSRIHTTTSKDLRGEPYCQRSFGAYRHYDKSAQRLDYLVHEQARAAPDSLTNGTGTAANVTTDAGATGIPDGTTPQANQTDNVNIPKTTSSSGSEACDSR